MNNVKALRTAQGLTQKGLAFKVGIVRQTLIAIEKGDYNPSLLLCAKLAIALDSTLDELFEPTVDEIRTEMDK
ncbi:Cro-Cl family transcriptional regulator [Furfurilactobacillus rossiae]|uniref:helix-turn-helix transcriptional regulator n=1 Tax=Furfurilactobacillus rossiae TaxID=231049 RepID=UPI0015BAE1FF|nr:helix-turn-helix transcriptional regulator [Furfurilactobacillus rossiae]MCF6164648.1 helix-turn-helix transcriptional regulator [Furfurilactobacillus rossiae]QLE64936.1 Cro-Cl family transcriptional regulator [Furfurilactobacillus rossiae]